MKKDQRKDFYLEFWKIDSVFLYEVFQSVIIFGAQRLKVSNLQASET